jgi:hypothetical protein
LWPPSSLDPEPEATEIQRRQIALVSDARFEPIHAPALRSGTEVKRLEAPLESLRPEGQASRSACCYRYRDRVNPGRRGRRMGLGQHPRHCDSGEPGFLDPAAQLFRPLSGSSTSPGIRSQASLPIRQRRSYGTVPRLEELVEALALSTGAFADRRNSDPRALRAPKLLPSASMRVVRRSWPLAAVLYFMLTNRARRSYLGRDCHTRRESASGRRRRLRGNW